MEVRRNPSLASRRLQIEQLEKRELLAATPIISEILASNNGVIQDEDGDYSDFIEIHNSGDAQAQLAGWYLTDDADDLTKWQFPSTSLSPGEYLVIFASNKNRAVAGSQLHTNFALSADGEFLALVRPDGATIASQFAPEFPPQYADVSYGVAFDTDESVFIDDAAPVKVFVPSNNNLGSSWIQTGFNDGSWQSGTTGVGYSNAPVAPPSTTVLQVDFNSRNNTGNTQPGFSSFTMSGSGIQAGPITRNYGPVSVTLIDASGFGIDDRSRSTPVNGGAFSEEDLLQDFVFSRDDMQSGGLDVSIDGLEAGETYTLTVWSYDSGSTGLRTSDWFANGVIAATDYGFDGFATPTSNDQYQFGVVVTADAQGKILLEGRRDGNNHSFAVFLNALRIETGDTLHPPAGAGDVLRVDFNSRTLGEPGVGDSEPGYSTFSLDENGSTISGIGVSVLPFNGASLGDRDRGTPVENAAFTLDQIYDDFIFSSGPAGSGLEVHISGLVPNTDYDLLLRSLDSEAAGNRRSSWTEVSSGQSVEIAPEYIFDGSIAPTTNDANAIRATLKSSAQGTLVLRGVQLEGNRSVVVNALELTRATFASLIGTDVKDTMQSHNASAYLRLPFFVAGTSDLDHLVLEVQYDSGFVAYLNGQEVARRNAPSAPGIAPAYNAGATAERSVSESLVAESIDISAYKTLLQNGSGNLLAIHAMNSSAGDEDFLILPKLRGTQINGQALRYFSQPTPGTANSAGVIDFVAEVQASAEHGFFTNHFHLSLQTPTPGADIYYTVDGSLPTPANPSAQLYQAPILIDTTTIIRTIGYREGYASSPVGTATYIYLNDVLAQSIDPNNPASNPFGLSYPAIWQANAAGDYNMDPEIVAQWNDNNPANQDFGIREALLSIPTMSIVMDHDDLWHSSSGIYPNSTSTGDAWRRGGSIEYIDTTSNESFQHNVGIQMHGAASRDNVRLKKHSFRLIFNPEFDGPGRLNFPLFDNSDFADINTVVLKAAFTDSFATRTAAGRYSPLDSTYTRDVSMLDSQRAMGSLAPDATYVHLYINGLYWGLYYPVERTDDAYLASHIGGEEEDWDVIKDFNELFRGESTSWNAMFSLARQLSGASQSEADAIYQRLQGRNPNGTRNPSYPVYLDTDNLIDYMLLHIYAGVEDWPSHNWVAARNRVDPGSGFQFFTWDQEISWDGRYRDRTEVSNSFTPAELYALLRTSPEFRLRFADRVQKHMFNDGALTVEATQERWQARADQIEAAIIAESARWGDAREGEVVNVPPEAIIPVMTVNHWRNSIAEVRDDYIPTSHPLTISRLTSDGLYSTIAAPQFSQVGGAITPGFQLGITSPSGGVLYYTTNGDDPRLLGGAVNAGSAVQYSQPVTLTGSTVVKARTLVGGQWSPLAETTFVNSLDEGGIVISEINYHPHEPTPAELSAVPGVIAEDFEFIEIVNTHPTNSINLANWSLANGLAFTFGDVTLAPGEYAVVVEDSDAFVARYGSDHRILGEWSGGVSNSGETIELRTPLGELRMAVSYLDVDPWSEAPDGDGATLRLIDPFNTPSEELGKWYRWRASTEFAGSPGEAGAGPIGVVINEVLASPGAGDLDAIELYNTTAIPIDIGGWHLSDSGGKPLKFQIPLGTILGAGQYIVFDENDFNPATPPVGQEAFALSGTLGDDVFLVIPDAMGGVQSFVDSVHFGPTYPGESVGRVPNASGRLAPQSQNTLGSANSTPRSGPLIITEVNIQPGPPSPAALAVDPTLTSEQLAFIEVFNPTDGAINLTGGGLAGAATFSFPSGFTLGPQQTVVLVPFDPASPVNASRLTAFRVHYGINASVTLLGPFTGLIAPDNGRIEIQLPHVTAPASPAGLVDETLYDNLEPWPTNVFGTGSSLNRLTPTAYGNFGGSWQGASPSPGSVSFSGVLPGDFDGDGSHTLADLDLLVGAIHSQSPIALFDLDDNGVLGAADVSHLVFTIVDADDGDFDWNGVVDDADYLTWKSRFGSTLYLNADGNRDGRVDAADYTLWRDNVTANEGAGSVVSVGASSTTIASAEESTEVQPDVRTSAGGVTSARGHTAAALQNARVDLALERVTPAFGGETKLVGDSHTAQRDTTPRIDSRPLIAILAQHRVGGAGVRASLPDIAEDLRTEEASNELVDTTFAELFENPLEIRIR